MTRIPLVDLAAAHHRVDGSVEHSARTCITPCVTAKSATAQFRATVWSPVSFSCRISSR